MKRDELTPDQLMQLRCAAIVGTATLAFELEELGISDRDESLDDARAIRPIVLRLIEDARGDG